jgi:DNA polymerase IV
VRKIIHIDMDAFFASVEQRDNPELIGKPIAVGGSGRRGVVAAASYEARKFGVRSAMAGSVAIRLCPQLIFVKGNYERYKEVSLQIREIFAEYTDLIEPLSLDEAYLDVTENKLNKHSATQIAEEIRLKIFEKTQLTASAGVSFTKFIAKTASDFNKPNGIKVVTPAQAPAFLDALPIEKFHGIGKVTAAKMLKLKIKNGADLKTWSAQDLMRSFGKAGQHFYKICRGEDQSPVNPHRIRKSLGAEHTFDEDLDKLEDMKAALEPLTKRVFDYMQKKENFGRTLTLKAKNENFQTHTRSKTFNSEIKDLQSLTSNTFDLLENNYLNFGKVRLLGVSVSNFPETELIQGTGLQLELEFE